MVCVRKKTKAGSITTIRSQHNLTKPFNKVKKQDCVGKNCANSEILLSLHIAPLALSGRKGGLILKKTFSDVCLRGTRTSQLPTHNRQSDNENVYEVRYRTY